MNTFVSYKDKSSAKRGFGRAFKDHQDAILNVDSYLAQEEGQWGFYKSPMGMPVLTSNQVPEAPADLNVLNDMAPKSPVIADQALEAAKEEESEDEPADPAASAFGAFALGQLTSNGQAADKQPAAASTSSKPIERNREESNGVKRPSAGTACAHVWDIATGLSNANGESKVPRLSEVVKAAEAVGLNKFTARTQYARWRVFHGITGRQE